MKESKLTKTVIISKKEGEYSPKTAYKVVKTSKLPPLSMELYARSGKQLQKKKKQVYSRIQEAESLIAMELGRTVQKTQQRSILGSWKIK